MNSSSDCPMSKTRTDTNGPGGRGDLRFGWRAMALLSQAAQFSAAERGVTRLFLSPEHRAAATWLMGLMSEAGLSVERDPAGSVVGRLAGDRPDAPALIIGSHQDSVREGGAYDGILGVILPLVCLEALVQSGQRLPYAIELVAFGDEEGCRFQQTLTGSRALAGTFDPLALKATDADGVSMEAAMREFGLAPEAIPGIARRPEKTLAFLEVHIEQGPVLERKGLPVGVVTAISGIERHFVRVCGKAGHAGTTPMDARRDALTGASAMVLALESLCRSTEGLVGVVGDLSVAPGALNVIPECVTFPVELRAPETSMRRAARDSLVAEFEEIAAARNLTLDVRKTYEADGVACAPWMIELLEAAVRDSGVAPHRLPSGAGHDGLAMRALCDIGMLFVRCKDGLSHHPDEEITVEDADLAAKVFCRCLELFASHCAPR